MVRSWSSERRAPWSKRLSRKRVSEGGCGWAWRGVAWRASPILSLFTNGCTARGVMRCERLEGDRKHWQEAAERLQAEAAAAEAAAEAGGRGRGGGGGGGVAAARSRAEKVERLRLLRENRALTEQVGATGWEQPGGNNRVGTTGWEQPGGNSYGSGTVGGNTGWEPTPGGSSCGGKGGGQRGRSCYHRTHSPSALTRTMH
jgi:hypothetical protein